MTSNLPKRPVEKWIPPGKSKSDVIDRPISFERLTDIEVAWPWPYTEHEAKTIGKLLPADGQQNAMSQIVTIGRRSVIARTVRATGAAQGRQMSTREDPRAEIERLRLALEGLSSDAQRILETFRFRTADLLTAAYAIEMSVPPAKPKAARGGAPRSRDAVIVAALRSVWEGAHGDNIPKRGYPAFEQACLAPLGFDLLKDDSARRHQRRTVKE